MSKKVVLMILDGWGIGNGEKSDVIANSKTPFVDSLYTKYANSTLLTDGENVGLPKGQMGNSEVGHLNIGAGRIVFQDLMRINNACADNSISENLTLKKAITYAEKNSKTVHLMGLVSNGGVHSSQAHVHKLCDILDASAVKKTYIHAFTDGRDCDPKSGKIFISDLLNHIKDKKVELATLVGRYYAMDRDKRWERIKLAYDLLVKGEGKSTTDFIDSLETSYKEGVTDEFIKPLVKRYSEGQIKEGDVVICFNFRTDRCREITTVLTQQDRDEDGMNTIPLHYVTMTNYDKSFKKIHVMFDKDNLPMTIGEVMEKNGKKQIRIAETEKYPHVTFFFSGGREAKFENEIRLMANSPKVATYDLQPEMSAQIIVDKICPELEKQAVDFVCLNFANPDMVGHTGVYSAIQKAVETVDACTQKVVETGIANGYSFIIIADHGNADFAINADGTPNTAHSTNPVPVFVIDKEVKKVKSGILADIAPTALYIMGVEQPKEMTGTSIIVGSVML